MAKSRWFNHLKFLNTTKKRNLETSILGKRKTVTITEMDRNLTDLRKQNNSIVPIIVHSFDATVIAVLIENITSNFTLNKRNLIQFKDCFAFCDKDICYLSCIGLYKSF